MATMAMATATATATAMDMATAMATMATMERGRLRPTLLLSLAMATTDMVTAMATAMDTATDMATATDTMATTARGRLSLLPLLRPPLLLSLATILRPWLWLRTWIRSRLRLRTPWLLRQEGG